MNEQEKSEMLSKSRYLSLSREISVDLRKLFDKYSDRNDAYALHSIYAGIIYTNTLLNSPTLEDGIEALQNWLKLSIKNAREMRKEEGRD